MSAVAEVEVVFLSEPVIGQRADFLREGQRVSSSPVRNIHVESRAQPQYHIETSSGSRYVGMMCRKSQLDCAPDKTSYGYPTPSVSQEGSTRSSVLCDEIIEALDQMFEEANRFFLTEQFVPAYEKCDDIKRYIEWIQRASRKKVAKQLAVGGAVLGTIVPGLGNLVGAASGAVLGYFAGGFIARQAFEENGTIEEISELAVQGKQEAKNAQSRKHDRDHRKLPPHAPLLQQAESLYSRWIRIRREVLHI